MTNSSKFFSDILGYRDILAFIIYTESLLQASVALWVTLPLLCMYVYMYRLHTKGEVAQ